MNLYKAKCLWLTDYTVKEVPAGGAEITDSWVLKAAQVSGLSVTVARPMDMRTDVLDAADFVIFSNNYEFPAACREAVIRRKPYIVYSHDSGRWNDVFIKTPGMCAGALGSIFLSPLHQQSLERHLSGAKNVVCVPPHITLDFYDKGAARENKVMFVGNVHRGKGVCEIIQWARKNPQIHIDFYYQRGQTDLLETLKRLNNCHLIGYVPKEEIFERYNRYRYFIHIPEHYESFGRAVGEAYLSGCQLIVNDRVGACSYGWNYSKFREMTANAHFMFWNRVEMMLKSAESVQA